MNVKNLYKSLLSSLSIFSTLCATGSSIPEPVPDFSTTEHIYAGANVAIRFDNDKEPEKNPEFTLANGLKISYGKLLSMPDFFGIVGKAASNAKTKDQAENNFMLNFNALANDSAAPETFNKIWKILQDEYNGVTELLQEEKDPREFMQSRSTLQSQLLNVATGGGSFISPYFPLGNYLKLAEVCFDHFGDDTIVAYNAGHRCALKEARLGYEILNGLKQPTQEELQKFSDDIPTIALFHLKKAYSLNAFASHYLMDRFAGGHIRTPLRELHNTVYPKAIGSRLANFMHNEDDCSGIVVKNRRNESWIVYGDSIYFSECNRENRERIQQVLQISADEIFEMYSLGKLNTPELIDSLIPYPVDEKEELKGHIQPAPLFKWNSKQQVVLRRINVSSTKCLDYTAKWRGWSTWALIEKEGAGKHGEPVVDQAILLNDKEKCHEYVAQGFITEPSLLQYYRTAIAPQ